MGVGIEVEEKSQAHRKCFLGATLGILSGIVRRGRARYTHFTDEETEAERD